MQFNAIYHGSMNSIFHMKICDSFLMYGPNIDLKCSFELPHWNGPNELPKIYILSKNKKNNVCTCKPHFSLFKVRIKGVLTAQAC